MVQLKPYRKESVAHRMHKKLCKKYFGPYKVLRKVNEVAYRLDLPEGSKIHPTFHVSRLKKFYGHIPKGSNDVHPIISVENQPIIYPIYT